MSKEITTLHIFRHAETEWNIQGKVQGHSDSPLTETGKMQAKELGKKLGEKGTPIKAIESSDLGRAMHTAQIVSDELGTDDQRIDIRPNSGLREQRLGAGDGLEVTEYAKLFTKWKDLTDEERFTHQFVADSETNAEAADRLTDAIKHIAEQHKGEHVGVCTHGHMLRLFLVRNGAGTFEEIKGVDNCGIVVVESDGQALEIKEMTGVRRKNT